MREILELFSSSEFLNACAQLEMELEDGSIAMVLSIKWLEKSLQKYTIGRALRQRLFPAISTSVIYGAFFSCDYVDNGSEKEFNCFNQCSYSL